MTLLVASDEGVILGMLRTRPRRYTEMVAACGHRRFDVVETLEALTARGDIERFYSPQHRVSFYRMR